LPNMIPGGYPAGLHATGKSQTIRIGWHEQPGIVASRIAFICPDCSRLCCRLHFTDAWRCRKCAKLDYWCRHRERTVPGLSRARWLRKRLGAGADPQLFAPIDLRSLKPSRSLRSNRVKRLQVLAELSELEKRIVGYLGERICDVLERREDARQRRRSSDPA
jgi:hypothetical protein